MSTPLELGAWGGSAEARHQWLQEARAEWLQPFSETQDPAVREEQALAWALRAGVPQSLVQLALSLSPEDAVAAEALDTQLTAIRPGARCDAVASAWWLWLCEQGAGSALKPLREALESAEQQALAESVNELHRRIVAGQDVAKAEWRRVRVALPDELGFVANAAWDFRTAPGTVGDVVSSLLYLIVGRRMAAAGMSNEDADAINRKMHETGEAAVEAVIGPAPDQEKDGYEALKAWSYKGAELFEQFKATYDDPDYLRWMDIYNKTHEDFRAVKAAGRQALAGLIAQA